MPSLSHKSRKYIPVHTTEEPLGSEYEKDVETSPPHVTKCEARWASPIIAACVTVVILLAVSTLGYLQTHSRVSTSVALSRCQNPIMRQEWRILSKDQQNDYINAALCLGNTPSKIHLGMALYEDFPFLHDAVGDYAHETAAFLTWHRYFIHLYESSLRSECGYKGSVPYWDWSLDWKDLSQSPVFQNSPGFGGDINLDSAPSKEAVVGGDRCVVEGPWAGMIVHWWTQSAPPHCLSRSFQDVKPMNEMGRYLSGEVLEELHNQPNYESFFMMMEYVVHNAVQVAIGGDIMFNTAPYDPLFYLHHSQLDRLWWRWQQTHPSRQTQYLGLANNFLTDVVLLDDLISMGDFVPAVTARDLINTEVGILCYRY